MSLGKFNPLAVLLLSLLVSSPSKATNTVITDFTDQTQDLQWTILNDNVMGGRSVGDFSLQPEHLYFHGSTNTTGGGFSSIRSAPLNLNLSEHQGFELNLLGDGRSYTWSLKTDATWRGRAISYWASFKTEANKKLRIKIHFKEFQPRFRGTKLSGPVLDQSRIQEIGLYIYDGNDGPFSLRLYSVGTF